MGPATITSAIATASASSIATKDAADATTPREAEGAGITAFRAWIVQSFPSSPGRYILRSITSFRVWEPNIPMRDTTHSGHRISETNDVGVFAWKTAERRDSEELPGSYLYAFGTVTLSGTIIEHERGYRAECATIRSLDRASDGIDLEALRKIYGVD